jgi:hypothetical protein
MSSGFPKAISQSHWGAVGALPSIAGQEHVATFSTTPLYHGGLADCFRSWKSGGMIWMFPESVAPMTGTNVIHAVRHAHRTSPVRVAYFTSVPYVLQALVEHPDGIELLQTMNLVGVGGTALDSAIGDRLVNADVRLVSRMGSAECGFLMSSHRDYISDKEWQYLCPGSGRDLLSFERRDDSLFEFEALPAWPVRVKPNRDDGSYATCDLF